MVAGWLVGLQVQWGSDHSTAVKVTSAALSTERQVSSLPPVPALSNVATTLNEDGRCEYLSSEPNPRRLPLTTAQYVAGVFAYNNCGAGLKRPPIKHRLGAVGTWHHRPATDDGEPIRHWVPLAAPWRRFSRDDAMQCLRGARLVFVGNSNTRTLYTALEALLRGTPMMSRLGAKQLCDNRQTNHSCWAVISGEGADERVSMHYISYIRDLYDAELEERVAKPFGFSKGLSERTADRHHRDVLFFNTGLNVIQGQHDSQWMPEHNKNAPRLGEFIRRFLVQGVPNGRGIRRPFFVWNPTTRICPHQGHFKRYKYKPKVWRGRTEPETNEAAAVSNSIIRLAIAELVEKGNLSAQVVTLHGDDMLLAPEEVNAAASNKTSRKGEVAYPNHLCPLYDDPLHHRFLDRELIQVFLNEYCR